MLLPKSPFCRLVAMPSRLRETTRDMVGDHISTVEDIILSFTMQYRVLVVFLFITFSRSY